MKLKSALVGFLSSKTWPLDPGIMKPLMQISVCRVPVPWLKHFWTGDDSFGTGTTLGRICALGPESLNIFLTTMATLTLQWALGQASCVVTLRRGTTLALLKQDLHTEAGSWLIQFISITMGTMTIEHFILTVKLINFVVLTQSFVICFTIIDQLMTAVFIDRHRDVRDCSCFFCLTQEGSLSVDLVFM